jgi:hypothetical protein
MENSAQPSTSKNTLYVKSVEEMGDSWYADIIDSDYDITDDEEQSELQQQKQSTPELVAVAENTSDDDELPEYIKPTRKLDKTQSMTKHINDDSDSMIGKVLRQVATNGILMKKILKNQIIMKKQLASNENPKNKVTFQFQLPIKNLNDLIKLENDLLKSSELKESLIKKF